MKGELEQFDADQIRIINESVVLGEELVSEHFKMSVNEWLRLRYDIKTLSELTGDEIIHGPFAQVIRYEGKRPDRHLGSAAYDFYKICLQDHTILSALKGLPDLSLSPFSLYIITHELIHIVRFCKFLQSFDASPEERMIEEGRVHALTHQVLSNLRIDGMTPVFSFYDQWRRPIDRLS
jgi:hypothetical protein